MNASHAEPLGQYISTELIDESPSNVRRTWGDMRELEESIRKVGILEPLLARPMGERFELVAGHRRLRAAKSLGLANVPVLARPMTDVEALEAQVAENSARLDVHPLEEAEAFDLLHQRHGQSVDEIAAKVGKSRAAVYARMKLLALCPEARKAFYAGALTPSTALFVARIPAPKLQMQAVKEIGPRDKDDDPATAREAQRIIADRFMLRLAEAPFDRGDATLVPAAGACTTCPKRTGNQAELFADVKSADVCTDPTCYRSKVDAVWKHRVAGAAAAGVKVMSDTAAKKAFYAHGQVVYDAGFVDLDAKVYLGSKKTTYRALLKKHGGPGAEPEITIARDHDRNIRELIPKSTADALQRRTRKEAPTTFDKEAKKQRDEQKKAREKKRLEERVRDLVITEATTNCERSGSVDVVFLRLVVELLLEGGLSWSGRNSVDRIARRHGLAVESEGQGIELVLDRLPFTSEAVCRSLLLELALESAHDEDLFERGAKAFDVNPGKLRKRAEKEPAPPKMTKANRFATSAPGTCSVCGCTEVAACETDDGPCAWANLEETLCTACA